MRKLLFTILSVAVWCAIAAYFIFASGLNSRQKSELKVEKVEVRISDAQKVNVVSEDMVRTWLKEAGYDFTDIRMADLNTDEMRRLVAGKPFVKEARVYSDMRGIVTVEISQRRPIVRFATSNGYNFYYSDDNCVIPVPLGSAMHVPVVTGNFRLPFERGFFGSLDDSLDEVQKKQSNEYAFLFNLINFVKSVAEDSFWGAQIVQVVVSQKGGPEHWREPEVEIVPRVGNFVVGLGTLVDIPKKLDRLMLFYRNVLPYEGWDNYRYINLKYNGQVVCSR